MEPRGLTSVEWEAFKRQQAEESARRQAKILCIAQMAATLEAGDRTAQCSEGWIGLDDPEDYAERALALFEAVEEVESNLPPQSEARV